MGVLTDQLEQRLPPGMSIPDPIRRLYQWIESKRMFEDRDDGVRSGFLFPREALHAGWADTERPGGTEIEFVARGNENFEAWSGSDDPEAAKRLCVFAQTGADGSQAAFWLDDDGVQKIVHLGSGSGSMLCCVLATEPVDFLRLLAIGYDEICWGEAFSEPPANDDFVVHPNTEFQEWVRETFKVTIPKSAAKLVEHPSSMDDDDPEDEFAAWVARIRG